MSEESEIIEELRESYKKYGPVHPVIQTHCGTAAGETRKKAVPQWKVVRMEVRDYYEHLKLKASDNIHAQKPANWWRNIINEAAAELAEKQHIPKGEITKHLVLDFPLSERSIRRYLSDQFKQAEKIEAGRRGEALLPPWQQKLYKRTRNLQNLSKNPLNDLVRNSAGHENQLTPTSLSSNRRSRTLTSCHPHA